jgi:hypothetical protein
MGSRNAFAFILVFIALPAAGGAQTPLHLTGNPNVDFFGGTQLTSSRVMLPASPALPQLTEEPAGKEKSPWLAGLMSLVVPGAGEVYSENYIKGAVFFAADVTAWAFAITYNKKGDRQTSEYQVYANEHWSAVRYANWTMDNINVLTNGHSDRTQYEDLVFPDGYPPEEPCGPPFRCVDWSELNTMEDSIGYYGPPLGNGYTHRLPHYGEQQYFELIGKYDEFSRGWDDADLRLINSSDLPLKNNSQRFIDYQRMRAESNHSYSAASSWVSVAVITHVISALDAYWSATRYNSALRAEVKMRFQPTEFGLVPVTEATVKYTF